MALPTKPVDPRVARGLLAVLRRDWDEARARLSPADGTALAEAARAADVHPWVHHLLETEGRLNLAGGDGAARLTALRRKCRLDNMLLLGRLEEVLDLLARAGIVPVALKGVDVVHRLGVPFDARTLDDVDLLVAASEVRGALDALARAGWGVPQGAELDHWLRSSHHAPAASPGPVSVDVEIHWNLVQDVRYRLDAGGLRARARPLSIAGRGLLRLENHDAVGHLLLHHLAHYFDRRLKWTVDLERLTAEPGFAWETVADRMRDWGASATAGLALLHLRKLRPDVVPPAALATMPAAGWRRALTAPLRSTHPLEWYRWSERRWVRMWIAAAAFEDPWRLPAYLLHREGRERAPEAPALREPREPGAPAAPLS